MPVAVVFGGMAKERAAVADPARSMQRRRSRLAVFYGLERAAEASRGGFRKGGGENKVEVRGFWLHGGLFEIYNVLIGYLLLHREKSGLRLLAKDALAAALHCVAHVERGAGYKDQAGWWIVGAVVLDVSKGGCPESGKAGSGP